jgi:cell division protein FtsB
MSRSERWTFRLIAAALIAGALGYVPWRIYGSQGYVHHRKLTGDLAELERKNAELRQKNRELAAEVARLTGDSAAIAQVARDELGMVAPGEMVLQIEPPAPNRAVVPEAAPPPPGAPGRAP